MTPIEMFIGVGGETVQIITKAGVTSKDYDPEEDPQPAIPDDDSVDVLGVYSSAITADLPQGCSGSFVIEATSLPTDLIAGQSILIRKGAACTIHSWRERVFRGEMDGYTLHLAS